MRLITFVFVALLVTACVNQDQEGPDQIDQVSAVLKPLASWAEGASRDAIIQYVEEVTDEASDNFIPVAERIAVFDNDGTLWSEQPLYFQLFFAFDRMKYLADRHPEWSQTQPYQSVLEDDMETLMGYGLEGLLQVAMATHTGMTTDEFDQSVQAWIDTARHPQKDVPYTDLIYQPMQELITYLEANGFKVFIVSGGGIDFMRVWVEEVYGLPRDQVVGTSIQKEYDYNDGEPVIRRLAEIDLIDDKGGKPVGIDRYIGRKPVLAGGNSDGDLEMMRWTDANSHPSLKLYVHHTDSVREWAYDRDSHIGGFNKALDEASEKNWLIISMKDDWKRIYPD
jgi:phosphoserine phosphatase